MTKVAENLRQREFDSTVHTVWVDEAEGVATYPLWNLTGQMVGYQQYRPTGEKKLPNDKERGVYYCFRLGVVGVWGLESWRFSNTLFVTEGVFDATRLTARGYSAVAVLSNDPCASTQRWFAMVRSQRPVVAVLDDDAAGYKLRRLAHTYHTVPGGDLGDASAAYVDNLVKGYC